MQRGSFEFRWGASVQLAESRAEVAVTGEAKIESESGQVVVPCQKIQCARQSESQLVPIKRHSLDLLENLSEIHGRNPQLAGNLSQSPAPREVARQDEFGPICQFLTANRCTRRMRGARPKSAAHQSQCQDLSFKGFRELLVQAMPQKRHKGLGARVDP